MNDGTRAEPNTWDLENREVSTAELDVLVKKLKEANEDYDKKKIISTEAFHYCEKLENQLVELLVMAGKTKYECEGVALVSIGHKASVTTPKTSEEKQKLFDFLENKFGHEGLMAYLSVNSATLNSLYNKELTEAQEKKIDFEMGKVLAIPTIKRTLSVRKKEFHMWVGKAIRDDQIKRSGLTKLQEERTNS